MLEEAERCIGLSVPDDHRVDYKLTEEDYILLYQEEKLLLAAMKLCIPTSTDGNEKD